MGAVPKDSHIKLRINSIGGDVFDGMAIHNALLLHPAGVSVVVDGLAASIASVIAMAGKTITMPENAFMMIHNATGGVLGDHEEMREFADVMERITASIANTYARRTGQSIKKIQEFMSDETWFTATEAKALGFADEVIEPVQMAARVNLSKFTKTPAALIQMNPPARSASNPGDPTPAPADPPEPIAAILAQASEKSQLIAKLSAEHKVADMTAELIQEFGPKPIEDISAYFAEVGQIRDMCVAARLPEEATRFIRARMSVECARDLLFKALQARDQFEIDNKIDPPSEPKKKPAIDYERINAMRNHSDESELSMLKSLRSLIDGRINGRRY